MSRGISPSQVEKPAFPAGVRGGAGGAVDRDGRGAVTWRRLSGISLSGHIPVPQCSPMWFATVPALARKRGPVASGRNDIGEL